MNTPLKNTTLIDVETPTRIIKLSDQWYLRMGPACWFFKTDIGYEDMTYQEAVEAEQVYQCLLSIKEKRLADRGPICWYFDAATDSWAPMAAVGTRCGCSHTIK